MAKQDLNLGNANAGDGDTLRGGGTKIKANFDEIYAEFGDGTNLSSGNTAGHILVADGTKFANVAMSGDIAINNSGVTSVASNHITIPSDTLSNVGSTTNKLYNVGGALFFNGASVGTGSVTGMTSFNVTADAGGNKAVTNSEVVTIAGGTGVSTATSGDQTVTINAEVSLAGTQTLTNKSLTAPTLTGSSSAAGSILFREDTDNGTNAVTLIGPAATADVTVTLPAATGTIALTSDITVSATSTNTFTNKTFDADATGNNLTNVEDANIKTGANIAQAKLNLAITTAQVAAATLVTASDAIGSNNNDTTIPTSAAVKAYADSVGGSSLTIQEEGSSLSTAATTINFVGAGVTATGSGATKTVTVGAGVSTLAALSDTTIASSAAGQTLLYDASDSYDNKQIKVFENNSAYTTALPMFFGSQMFTVSAADTTNGYTFENFNSNGSDANNGGSGAGQTLYVFEDQVVVFYLKWGSGHPFAIRTGASGGGTGTNLVTGNGGDNLIYIDPNGTVTTGTSANAKSSGYLIWKVPHFGSDTASTYYYQCTSHGGMYGLIKIKAITY
mgnify:CR=1 FL=1